MTEIEVWSNKNPATEEEYPYEVVKVEESESHSLGLFSNCQLAELFKRGMENEN